MKILIRTGKCEAIVERGVYFLPTIGTVNPDGFTTSHPQARSWFSERDSFSLLHNS
jgi:hypothetical protein